MIVCVDDETEKELEHHKKALSLYVCRQPFC